MFVGKMCVFVSRPKESVTLHQKNGDLLKLVVDFLRENTFRWKSSRMSTKKVTTTTANPRNRRRFCVRRQNPHKSSEISRLFSSIFIFHCYFSIFAFFHFPFFTFIVSFFFSFFSFFFFFFIFFLFSGAQNFSRNGDIESTISTKESTAERCKILSTTRGLMRTC